MYEAKFTTKRTKNNELEVRLNGAYTLKPQDKYFDILEFLIHMINEKNAKEYFPPELGLQYFPTIEFELGKMKMDDEKCMVCLDNFQVLEIEKQLGKDTDEDIYALPCSHIYHKACLVSMIGKNLWVKCPICSTIYGKMMGDQPDGKMTHRIDKNLTLPGYGTGAIIINYNMPAGVRNGKNYPGTTRVGYLPNNPQGTQVLKLLQECFHRKLTFTIGRSVTTGLDNQIVWNGIHHKTSTSGGAASFGYPDPTYLKRVKEQLAAKGIK